MSLSKAKKVILICIIFIYTMFAFLQTGVYFETNDDCIITEILSGSLTGKPDAHAVFLNYILSLPLSGLYSITTKIPWYGIFLILTHIVSVLAIVNAFLKRCSNKTELTIASCSSFVLVISNIYIFSCIQFTSTAALLAISGYAVLLTEYSEKKKWILFFVTELFAFLIRPDAMLMVQPLGIVLFGGYYITVKSFQQNKKYLLHQLSIWTCSLLLIYIIGLLGDHIGYNTPEWKEYNRFTQARSILFDYYAAPPYDEVEEILNKYDVTRNEYNAFTQYVILDTNINADCMEELVNYAKQHNAKEASLIALFKEFFQYFTTTNDYTLNIRGSMFLWLCAFIGCILSGKFSYLVTLSGLAIVRTMLWTYLIYRGRLPYRITLPLMYMEVFMLLFLCLNIYNTPKKNFRLVTIAGIIFCLCFLKSSYTTFQVQYKKCLSTNKVQDILIAGYSEVLNYCNEQPRNCYILDGHSFSSCNGSALDADLYGPRNSIHSGGWYSTSPNIMRHLDNYLGDWSNDIYYIVYDGQNDPEPLLSMWLYGTEYLEIKTGRTPVLVDYLSLPSGANFFVWKY